MLKRIIFSLFIFYPYNSFTQTVFISQSGEVAFFSHALIEDIQANSKQVNSIINSLTGEIAFAIPIRSFQFPKSLMQEHFNEKYMESDKFPQATFNGTIEPKIDFSKNGIFELSAKGKMNIHGVENIVEEKGRITIEADTFTLITEFRVALEDYKIKKPQLMFNNIADTILVKMKAIYVPFKKQ